MDILAVAYCWIEQFPNPKGSLQQIQQICSDNLARRFLSFGILFAITHHQLVQFSRKYGLQLEHFTYSQRWLSNNSIRWSSDEFGLRYL